MNTTMMLYALIGVGSIALAGMLCSVIIAARTIRRKRNYQEVAGTPKDYDSYEESERK